MLTLDNQNIKPFRNKIEFSTYIEKYAITNGVSIMASFLQYCEDADVDIEDCVKYISDSLKEKIEEEAITEKFMTRRKIPLQLFE